MGNSIRANMLKNLLKLVSEAYHENQTGSLRFYVPPCIQYIYIPTKSRPSWEWTVYGDRLCRLSDSAGCVTSSLVKDAIWWMHRETQPLCSSYTVVQPIDKLEVPPHITNDWQNPTHLAMLTTSCHPSLSSTLCHTVFTPKLTRLTSASTVQSHVVGGHYWLLHVSAELWLCDDLHVVKFWRRVLSTWDAERWHSAICITPSPSSNAILQNTMLWSSLQSGEVLVICPEHCRVHIDTNTFNNILSSISFSVCLLICCHWYILV